MEQFIVGAADDLREREREREREMQSLCRAGGHEEHDWEPLWNIDFETCESIRIIRRQNHDSYMNRFLRAPLVFSSSSLKQHNMASPPSLRVPGGGVYLGLWRNGPGK